MYIIQKVKITVIVDELNGAEPGYIKSFGFSAMIEINDKKILFDAGTKKDVLMANLTTYGIDLSSIDAVILSHNHYDHANGLSIILENNIKLPVYVHKYWEKPVRHKGEPIPPENKRIIEQGRLLEELEEELYITNAYMSPDYGGIYEQACYIKAKDSYILICGCSHPGLISFLNDRENLGIPMNTPLHIIGGFHGFKFDDDHLQKLEPLIHSIMVCHCTKNVEVYKKQFRDKCFIATVGKSISY